MRHNIIAIEETCLEEIKMNTGTYRRYSADSWEQLFGQSWEVVSFPEEQENAYQDYLRNLRKNAYVDTSQRGWWYS